MEAHVLGAEAPGQLVIGVISLAGFRSVGLEAPFQLG
jgi:hypothetical protein